MQYFFLFLFLFSGLAAFLGLINPKIVKCQKFGRFKTFMLFISLMVGSFIAFGMAIDNKYSQTNKNTAAAQKSVVNTPAVAAIGVPSRQPLPPAPVPAKKPVAAASGYSAFLAEPPPEITGLWRRPSNPCAPANIAYSQRRSVTARFTG